MHNVHIVHARRQKRVLLCIATAVCSFACVVESLETPDQWNVVYSLSISVSGCFFDERVKCSVRTCPLVLHTPTAVLLGN